MEGSFGPGQPAKVRTPRSRGTRTLALIAVGVVAISGIAGASAASRRGGGRVWACYDLRTGAVQIVNNFDNNQHEENENLRLGHLFQAIEIIAAILRS